MVNLRYTINISKYPNKILYYLFILKKKTKFYVNVRYLRKIVYYLFVHP